MRRPPWFLLPGVIAGTAMTGWSSAWSDDTKLIVGLGLLLLILIGAMMALIFAMFDNRPRL